MTFLWSLNGGQNSKFSPTFGGIQHSEFYIRQNVVQNVTFSIPFINLILVRLEHRNPPCVKCPIMVHEARAPIAIPTGCDKPGGRWALLSRATGHGPKGRGFRIRFKEGYEVRSLRSAATVPCPWKRLTRTILPLQSKDKEFRMVQRHNFLVKIAT